MESNSADVRAEILQTTLYLVEQRQDLDQNEPSVIELKESMRRKIAELKENKKPPETEGLDSKKRTTWSDKFSRKKRP